MSSPDLQKKRMVKQAVFSFGKGRPRRGPDITLFHDRPQFFLLAGGVQFNLIDCGDCLPL